MKSYTSDMEPALTCKEPSDDKKHSDYICSKLAESEYLSLNDSQLESAIDALKDASVAMSKLESLLAQRNTWLMIHALPLYLLDQRIDDIMATCELEMDRRIELREYALEYYTNLYSEYNVQFLG